MTTITVTRLHNGAFEVSAIIGGYLVRRTYYGFNAKAARSLFRAKFC